MRSTHRSPVHLGFLVALALAGCPTSGPHGVAPHAIDWASVAGIEGGIPPRTDVCADLSGLDGTGASDVGPMIQAALDACPRGQTVLLGAGTFRVDGDVVMRREVTLRGAGAATILRPSGAVLFSAGLGHTVVNVVGEAPVGATSLALEAPPASLTVGSTVLLNELDDPSYVHPYGYEEEATAPLHCTYCDEPDLGTRVRSQMVRVTAIEGSTIRFSPALYSGFSAARAPRILYPAAADDDPNVLTYAGLEDLVLDPTGTGFAVRFERAQNCWMTGVEVEIHADDTPAVYGYYAHRIAIGHGRFTGHVPTAQAILSQVGTEGWLVEDNLFEDVSLTFLNVGRQGGHVFAYNALSRYLGPTTALLNDNGNHGAHPQFLLFEGNSLVKHHADSIHGSSSHHTLFRNHFRCDAPGATFGRGCVWIDSWNTGYTVTGNVLGTPGMTGFLEEVESPAPIDDTPIVFRFGYSGYNAHAAFPDSRATTFRHGNYLFQTDTVTWDPSAEHALPASLYLTERPDWFGDTPWPPFGPDVPGYVSELPAERRYAGR